MNYKNEKYAEMINLKEIGQILRKERENQRYSQTDIAKLIGGSTNTIYLAEKTGNIRVLTLLKICKALNVSPVEIIKKSEGAEK